MSARTCWGLLGLALLGCAAPSEESAGPQRTGSPSPTDSGPPPTTEPAPVDADEDGYIAEEDCDDYDPSIHPGAIESWDGEDEDCDGRVDGDGRYTGSLQLEATAEYEGETLIFELDCPAALERLGEARVEWDALCSPDPADADAQRMLGATLALSVIDNAALSGPQWEGAVSWVSPDWQSTGEGAASWPSFSEVELSASMSSAYLQLQASGRLLWQEEPGD